MPSDTRPPAPRDRITVAVMALGGQGGGVLADWIIDVANANGWIAQGTSVPGVAQRTGATIYYIEMVPRGGGNRTPPVLALNPVPGDVDVVVASELMEAGRAILRGFVTGDRTTLIGSTHRVYAIAEKSAMGGGAASGARILAAAQTRARQFIGFDMDAAAREAGSVISSVMLGALAGSGALPFAPEAFEAAIRHGGKAVGSNLAGFALGARRAVEGDADAIASMLPPVPTSDAGRALAARIATLPAGAQATASFGAAKLTDWQDAAYAGLYLDRLEAIAAADPGDDDHAVTRATARHLALWMAYDDVIRVADLKIRGGRADRVRREALVGGEELHAVTEYMHPRLREICDVLPARLGRRLGESPRVARLTAPLFRHGRHVETTRLRWFLLLRLIAGLRRFRRSSLRYAEEQGRIGAWLTAIGEAAAADPARAAELARAQRLIKGYGDTFDRGLTNFELVLAEGASAPAERIRRLHDAALADDKGVALRAALRE